MTINYNKKENGSIKEGGSNNFSKDQPQKNSSRLENQFSQSNNIAPTENLMSPQNSNKEGPAMQRGDNSQHGGNVNSSPYARFEEPSSISRKLNQKDGNPLLNKNKDSDRPSRPNN